LWQPCLVGLHDQQTVYHFVFGQILVCLTPSHACVWFGV
jgi:hypothetical protein